MGDFNLTIDGSALQYLEEKIKGIFGKDFASKESADWLISLHDTALVQTRDVKCVGMHRPVPFDDIYQPTTLTIKVAPKKKSENYAYQDKTSRSIIAGQTMGSKQIGIEDLLRNGEDCIIYAGPGWGKTIFLHHLHRRFAKSHEVFAALITLRRPKAVGDLIRLVKTAQQIKKKRNGKSIVLLVDGYDEIPVAQRKLVSEALLLFQSLDVGSFYLTCRDYYDVLNISAAEVRIGGFSPRDKYRFVKAFLKAIGSRLDARTVVDELHERGFADFLSHPLLLALACIVKTAPCNVEPRSAIRLLERAIDVLKDRWDQKKGIIRETSTPLDGRDRIQLLKRIAFIATSSGVSRLRAETNAQAQIDLLNFDKIDARKALFETAQFYGILIPSEDGWEFVHRTIHDFLAAMWWVESGEFASVKNYEWNTRTAYAACLTQNATAIFKAALEAPDGLPAAAEMLSNAAPMDHKVVALALKNYFAKPGRAMIQSDAGSQILTVVLSSNLLHEASSRLLDRLVDEYSKAGRTKVTDAIVTYCLLELKNRRLKLDFVTFDSLKACYKQEDFLMQVSGIGAVKIGEMNPAAAKIAK